MSESLKGRTVVVTGGSSGIGAAIVAEFATHGARPFAIDLNPPSDEVAGAAYLQGDVTELRDVRSAIDSVLAATGRIDMLVNNAGIQRVGLTEDFDPSEWRQVVDVHLFGAFNCTAVCLPTMKSRETGSIVNMASIAALVGVPGRGPYSAAKGAITAWTRSLAVEVAPSGVRVNAVAPGSVLTQLVQQGIDDGSIIPSSLVTEIPFRRLGETGEVAKAVRFLASDEASYITGHTLVVDGGWTVQAIRDRPDWLR